MTKCKCENTEVIYMLRCIKCGVRYSTASPKTDLLNKRAELGRLYLEGKKIKTSANPEDASWHDLYVNEERMKELEVEIGKAEARREG